MEHHGEHVSEHGLDEDLTVRFEVTVRCTSRGVAARINYDSNDSPPEGAEFEFVEAVMYICHVGGEIKSRQDLTWNLLDIMVGEQEAQRLVEAAMDKASASGEFGPPGGA